MTITEAPRWNPLGEQITLQDDAVAGAVVHLVDALNELTQGARDST